MATKQQINEFIEKVWKGVQNVNMQGLFPSVVIAQAALESGWGQSELAKKYNNYFGIVADSGWKGGTIKLPGNSLTFRTYEDFSGSIKDHNKFLRENKRYEKAGVFSAATPEEQAAALQAAGYAGTSTTYASKIVNIINTYNLKDYDDKKKVRTVVGGIGIGITVLLSIFLILKVLKND